MTSIKRAVALTEKRAKAKGLRGEAFFCLDLLLPFLLREKK